MLNPDLQSAPTAPSGRETKSSKVSFYTAAKNCSGIMVSSCCCLLFHDRTITEVQVYRSLWNCTTWCYTTKAVFKQENCTIAPLTVKRGHFQIEGRQYASLIGGHFWITGEFQPVDKLSSGSFLLSGQCSIMALWCRVYVQWWRLCSIYMWWWLQSVCVVLVKIDINKCNIYFILTSPDLKDSRACTVAGNSDRWINSLTPDEKNEHLYISVL